MSEQLSSQKALKDLSTIRDTIDRATGAHIFTNFIYSTGTLMAVSGIIVLITCIINFLVMGSYTLSCILTKSMGIMWLSVITILFLLNFTTFALQAKKHNMKIFSYYKQIANKSFIQIDIPIELMTFLFILLFIKIGLYEYIIPTCVIGLAVLFTSLGTVFLEKSFSYIGYIFLTCGAIGLFFMAEIQLIYIACVLGVMPVILGLVMHGRYKQLKEAHMKEYKLDTEEIKMDEVV